MTVHEQDRQDCRVLTAFTRNINQIHQYRKVRVISPIDISIGILGLLVNKLLYML